MSQYPQTPMFEPPTGPIRVQDQPPPAAGRAGARSVLAVLNPPRLAFGAAAVAAFAAFGYVFVVIRADPDWIYYGWTCRGWLPLALTLITFALTVALAARARASTAARWTARRARTTGISPAA